MMPRKDDGTAGLAGAGGGVQPPGANPGATVIGRAVEGARYFAEEHCP
jgi:hypothetical protein